MEIAINLPKGTINYLQRLFDDYDEACEEIDTADWHELGDIDEVRSDIEREFFEHMRWQVENAIEEASHV